MKATMFTGWIYDDLKPHAASLKVAHPLMLRAIAPAKKKNDRIDASKIYDCRHATVQAAQQTSTDRANRGREDGATLQPNAGAAL